MSASRYEVVRELARGGMGRVLLAHDTYLERKVAVKALLDDPGAADDRAVARMVEEAQVTGQLAHPSIVPLHELGGEGADLFIVMKLVEGRTLKDLVRELEDGGPARAEYGLRRLLRLFLDVCEAVAYAHGRGVVHRDLKPANVMIGHDDEVLVMDWGVAKPIGSAGESAVLSDLRESAVVAQSGDVTGKGAIVGTPAYMPPEQCEGSARLDARVDVYALGATLYELVTRRPPYRGSSYEVIAKLVRGPPPRPREAAPDLDVPRPLEAIVLRAMARAPEERYPDASALARDVERFLDGRAVSAYRDTAREAFARWTARHWVAALTAGAAAALLVALGAVGLRLVRAEQARLRAESEAARASQAESDQARLRAAAAAEETSLTARAVEVAGQALWVVDGLQRRAELVVDLSTGDEGAEEAARQAVRALRAEHEAARERLAACRASLAALAGPGHEPTSARVLAPFLEEVDTARRLLDRKLLDALLGRAPEVALAALDGLDLGPWRPVYAARAHARLGDRAAALAAVASTAVAATAPSGDAARDAARDAACDAACDALRAQLDETRPPAEVEAAFTRALELEPTAAWLYAGRAEARTLLGASSPAQADYERALRLDRLDAWIHSSSFVHTYLPAYRENSFADPGRFARQLAPGNVEAQVFDAWCNLWRGGGAWDGFERALARVSSRPDALRWRADGALMAGRLEEADEAARELLALDAQDRVGLGAAAEVLLRRGATGEAAARADEGLVRYPQDGRLNRVRGRAALQQGDAARAARWLEVGARPSLSSEDWAVLADCLARSDDPRDWERGVEAARRGMALDVYAILEHNASARPVPGDPRLHRALGRLRMRQGRHAAAALHFVRAFHMGQQPLAARALGTDLQDALLAGEAHEALGLPAEAVQLYALALEDPRLREDAEARIRRLTGGPR